MTQQFHLLDRCVGALVFAAAITTSAVASAGPVVYVTNVEQLYDALDHQPNEGAAVVLASGIYLLLLTGRPCHQSRSPKASRSGARE